MRIFDVDRLRLLSAAQAGSSIILTVVIINCGFPSAATRPSYPKEKVKAPVPLKDERPVMGLVSAKNFVTSNAVENILSQPRKVYHEPALSTNKPDYGQVPTYLKKIKNQVENERTFFEHQIRQQEMEASAGTMRRMGEGERHELIIELKKKWGRVNEAYQKLPFTLDTPMRKFRKEKLESELTQLEKDIETLNRKTVLISEDY